MGDGPARAGRSVHRSAVSEWKLRRNWSSTGITVINEGFAIALDGHSAKTPSGNLLELPTRRMSELICAEWEAQQGEIDPALMPFTRLANTAIDRVETAREEVIDAVVGYAESDLLCHRAERPEELAARQRNAWDQVIEWAGLTLGAPLNVGFGVMPIRQSRDSLCRLREETASLERFGLAGLSEMVALTGSLLLGLAVIRGRLTPENAWNISRIDEEHQTEEWGFDTEAGNAARRRREAFITACEFVEVASGRTTERR